MEIITHLRNPDWWIENSLNDLYFFCRCVLQILEDPTPGLKDLYEPTHRRLCRFVEKYAYAGQLLLILMPRHWLKSYIITAGWNLQQMLKNLIEGRKDHRVITNATLGNAQEFLGRIKYNLQYNEQMRGLFHKWIPEDPERNAERWKLEGINVGGNRIDTGSAEKDLTSRHFMILLNDDLQNRENSATKDQIRKVIDWWGLAKSLLHPKGIEIDIGTRWGFDDVYGHIIENFLEIPKEKFEDLLTKPSFEWHNGKYHLLQYLCWEDPVSETGSTFPVLFPEEKLKEIQKEQRDRFPGQYENNPLKMGTMKFKPDWFERYKEALLPKIQITGMLIDPTGVGGEESDFTGIVHYIAGVDRKLYIPRAFRCKDTDLQLAARIAMEAKLMRPMRIGIEDTKYRSVREFLELIVPNMIRKGTLPKELANLPYICYALKPRGRPKTVRIETLQPWIESGRMQFAPKGMDDLFDELIRYGTSIRDDIIDALAYILDSLRFPTEKDPPVYLRVPEALKMTPEEREAQEWEQYRDEVEEQEAGNFEDGEMY